MNKKSINATVASFAALALALQACTPNSQKVAMGDGSITVAKLADSSVTSSKILDGTISTADIGDASVTAAKLAPALNIAAGNITVAGTLGITGITTASQSINLTKTDTTNYGTAIGVIGMLSTMRAANTAVSTELYYGGFFQSEASTAQTSTQMTGLHGQVNMSIAGSTVTTAMGLSGELNFDAAGTITNGYALRGALDLGAGTVTNYRGLSLEDPVAGVATYNATRYGVYSAGPINNYFQGRIGVANTLPEATVEITGGLCVSALTTDNCTGTADGQIRAQGTIDAANLDLAERFPTQLKIEPGTIVTADSSKPHYVREATAADTQVMGIISTKPGLVLGWENGEAFKDAPHTGLIAMAGRVPLKVTGEGGSIRIGDAVMLSSVSGHGMKADPSLARPLVGIALENFDAKSAQHRGSILTFVRNHESPKSAGSYFTSLLAPVLKEIKEVVAKLSGHEKQLASLEKKIEVENIALRMENQELKNRLDKIERALAQAAQPQNGLEAGPKLAHRK